MPKNVVFWILKTSVETSFINKAVYMASFGYPSCVRVVRSSAGEGQ